MGASRRAACAAWLAAGLLGAAGLVSCTFEASYDGTSRFACADGVCPTDFSCVAAVCVPDDDINGDLDASLAPDARLADAAPDASTVGGPADAAPEPDASPPCIEGDTRVTDPETGTCYMRFATGLNWTNAGIACEAFNARLAEVTSAKENALVTSLYVGGAPDAWLGASDISVENTWRWRGGTLMAYDNWRLGEPNNGVGSMPMVAEDCAVIELDTAGTWDDRNCGIAYPFICER